MSGLIVLAVPILLIVVVIAGVWKVFEKAGQPGWAAIIPIYNLYVLTQVAGMAWWWVLLCMIPFVNVIGFILISLGVAKNFGKGAGFAVGLIFLGFIFYPILGFGDAVYGTASPAPQPAA
jgi:hypothetical protein